MDQDRSATKTMVSAIYFFFFKKPLVLPTRLYKHSTRLILGLIECVTHILVTHKKKKKKKNYSLWTQKLSILKKLSFLCSMPLSYISFKWANIHPNLRVCLFLSSYNHFNSCFLISHVYSMLILTHLKFLVCTHACLQLNLT